MKITVTGRFISSGFDAPAVGTLLDVDDTLGRHLIDAGVAVAHETRIDVRPLKKKELPSMPVAPALPAKIAKKRRPSAKK